MVGALWCQTASTSKPHLVTTPTTIQTREKFCINDFFKLNVHVRYYYRFGNDYGTIPVLLEILVVLPEEVSNRKLRLGENHRTKWREVFGSQCSIVLQLLESCIVYWPNEETIQIQVSYK